MPDRPDTTKRRVRKLLRALAVCLIMVGIAVIAAPTLVQTGFQAVIDSDKASYDDAIGGASDDRLSELRRLLDERNRFLAEDGQKALSAVDSYETDDIDLMSYGLPERDVLGYVEVPVMGVRLPIVLGASEANMRRGACHMTGTSYPIGGTDTNCVLAAHRADGWGLRLFRDIERVETGDRLVIHGFDGNLEYTCVDTRVVEPWDVDAILIQPGRDLITLATCHPYGSNAKRYIAVFERV